MGFSIFTWRRNMEHRVVSQLPCERCAALQAENARLRDLIALINREKDRFIQRLENAAIDSIENVIKPVRKAQKRGLEGPPSPESPANGVQKVVKSLSVLPSPAPAPIPPSSAPAPHYHDMKSSGILPVPLARANSLVRRTGFQTPLARPPSPAVEPTAPKQALLTPRRTHRKDAVPASASDYASPDVLAEADRAPPRPQPRDVAEEVYEDEEEPLMSQRSDSVGLTQYENVFFAQEECAAACGGGPEVCPPVLPVPAPVAAPVERVSPPADAVPARRGLEGLGDRMRAQKKRMTELGRLGPAAVAAANVGGKRAGPAPFKFKDGPVRGKERDALTGRDCEDCRKFLAAIGDPVKADQLRQLCSRHRTTHEPAATPPGYWDLSMQASL